jgi:phosphohistidine phosphatase SixA
MQVKASLNSLSKYNFDRILSSDELRAIETSMIVSKSLNSDFETYP